MGASLSCSGHRVFIFYISMLYKFIIKHFIITFLQIFYKHILLKIKQKQPHKSAKEPSND